MDIEPANNAIEWSCAAIDFCTENITETHCHINIYEPCDENGVYPCKLTNEENGDLSFILISRNFAQAKTLKIAVEESIESAESHHTEICSRPKFDPEDLCDVLDYKKLFERTIVKMNKELQQGKRYLSSLTNRNRQLEPFDGTQIEFNTTFDPNTISTSTSIYADERNDSIIDRICSLFEQYRLDICTRNLLCDVLMVIDPLTVIVAPTNFIYTSEYNKMVLNLQEMVTSLRPLGIMRKHDKCIAYSTEEKLWKRAMIMDCESNKKTVVFVDSLQVAIIDNESLREFPQEEYLMLPLRYIEAHLYGLRPNRRLRPDDISNQLWEVLQRKQGKTHMKIISTDSKPQIEIYSKFPMEQVIYSSLIAKGFYSKLDSIPC